VPTLGAGRPNAMTRATECRCNSSGLYMHVTENHVRMPQWSSGMIPALGLSKLQEVPDSISG
jgi:hypothetical protein